MNAQERQDLIDRWEMAEMASHHLFVDDADLEKSIERIQAILEDWGELPEFAMLAAAQFMDMLKAVLTESGGDTEATMFAMTKFCAMVGFGALRKVQSR